MDRLKLCMDALRALAIQSADPNWYLLAEREITQYLQSSEASPQKLREAIDREAETSQDYVTFWPPCRSLLAIYNQMTIEKGTARQCSRYGEIVYWIRPWSCGYRWRQDCQTES